MKFTRKIALLLTFALLFGFAFAVVGSAEGEQSESGVQTTPNITSGNAAIAYCIDDEQFLYADRIDEKVAPAVATKLVACMVAIDILKERGLNSADTQVTVTSTAIDNSGDIADVRIPMMGLKVGNVYSTKDLLGASLVACANDAIASIACHFGEKFLGGGINEFVDRMNKKVEDLGLKATHFVNPTGLDAPNQYSTPREVTLIAAAFYRYDELVKLSDVESFFFNGSSTIRNKNYLKSNYYVDGFLNKKAIGLIAGQLNKAGNYCLITATQKEGRTYIYVVMCASGMIVTRDEEDRVTYSFGDGNAYVDMNKLIDWTLSSFKLLAVATSDSIVGELRVNTGQTSYVRVVPSENVEKLVLDIEGGKLEAKLTYDESIVFKKDFENEEYDTIDAPVTAGQKVGTITYSYNGLELATVDAVAKESVDSDGLKSAMSGIKGFLFGDDGKFGFPNLGLVEIVLLIIVIIIAVWIIFSIVMAVLRANRGTKENANEKTKNKKTVSAKKATQKKRDPKGDTREIP